MSSTASDKPREVGVIGLGNMGSAFATNLLARGYKVHVYNRTQQKATPLKEKGAIVHSTPKELGSSVEVVITSLTDQNAIDQVAHGSDGFLSGLKQGALWIDMSTIDPDASIRHHREARERGIQRLDAPVSGGPGQASKGEVMVLIGGSEDLFKRYQSFLNELGKTVVYLGPDGSGHKMKLVVNMYMGLIANSFSEALVLSKKFGFQPKTFVETINKTNHKNGFTETKGPKVAEGKFDPTFSLNNLLKDLRLAHEQAKKNSATLPLGEASLEKYTRASNSGLGQKDFSAIAQEIAKDNGLTI